MGTFRTTVLNSAYQDFQVLKIKQRLKLFTFTVKFILNGYSQMVLPMSEVKHERE